MKDSLALLIQNTDVRGSGMKVDSTVIFVLLGVKSRRTSPLG